MSLHLKLSAVAEYFLVSMRKERVMDSSLIHSLARESGRSIDFTVVWSKFIVVQAKQRIRRFFLQLNAWPHHFHFFSLSFPPTASSASLPADSKLMCVFISNAKGEELSRSLSRMNESIDIRITISPNTTFYCRYSNVNRTSVLFVSVSFILLMFISLTWLIVYYVQRFRDLQAKDILTVSTFISMVILASSCVTINLVSFFFLSVWLHLFLRDVCVSQQRKLWRRSR